MFSQRNTDEIRERSNFLSLFSEAIEDAGDHFADDGIDIHDDSGPMDLDNDESTSPSSQQQLNESGQLMPPPPPPAADAASSTLPTANSPDENYQGDENSQREEEGRGLRKRRDRFQVRYH